MQNDAWLKLVKRLSHLAEGHSVEVDTLLDRMRDKLDATPDEAAIGQLSDELAKQVMKATGQSIDSPKRACAAYDLSGLTALAESFPGDESKHREMVGFVQAIATAEDSHQRQVALARLLSNASDAVKAAAVRSKEKKAGRGLFSRKSDDDEPLQQSLSLFATLTHRLVEHIDIINGEPVTSSPVRRQLQALDDLEAAADLTAAVTEAIDEIDRRIRDERSQSTQFLGSLQSQISDVEKVIFGLAEMGQASVERSEALQTSVGEDMNALGAVARVSDITQLREQIAKSMEIVRARLSKQVDAEREQNDDATEQIQELNARLAALEREAQELRNEVDDKNSLISKDALTGVFNRAGFEERAIEFYSRWQRTRSPLSIAFVDCNKFKEINDTYGHAAGDLVLIKVADVLRTRSRASDVVCRYGGDEFVVLLPDTEVKGAAIFARNACEEVLGAGFNDNGKPLDVSISCGVVQMQSGDTMEAAMERADKAMYLAKQMDEDIQVHTGDVADNH